MNLTWKIFKQSIVQNNFIRKLYRFQIENIGKKKKIIVIKKQEARRGTMRGGGADGSWQCRGKIKDDDLGGLGEQISSGSASRACRETQRLTFTFIRSLCVRRATTFDSSLLNLKILLKNYTQNRYYFPKN